MTNPLTPPVDTDETVSGCVKWLQTFPDVIDSVGSFPDGTPWLFQDDLYTTVESSQSQAAVISYAGGWAGPNPYNTLRFPRLSLDIVADPMRDSGGNPIRPGELKRRVMSVYKVFDTHLHRPQGGDQTWGTVRTIAAARLGEPFLYPLSAGGGAQRLQVFYGITEG